MNINDIRKMDDIELIEFLQKITDCCFAVGEQKGCGDTGDINAVCKKHCPVYSPSEGCQLVSVNFMRRETTE